MIRISRRNPWVLFGIALSLAVGTAELSRSAASQSSPAAQDANGASNATRKDIKFEVFSIRPSKADAAQAGIDVTPSGFKATMNLWSLIMLAFNPQLPLYWKDVKIQNAPQWLSDDSYSVDARVADADVAVWKTQGRESEMVRGALRAALKERCKLQLHVTPIEVPYLDLVVGKRGPKLKEATPGVTAPARAMHLPDGGVIVMGSTERQFFNVSMNDLATRLTAWSRDFPVQDKTGLTGRYDFALPWDSSQETDSLDRMPVAGIGLALRPGKGPAYTLTIDHVEKPDAD
jgi:bla regulator protein BlaR1